MVNPSERVPHPFAESGVESSGGAGASGAGSVDGLWVDGELSTPAVDLAALRASALRQARWLMEFYRITPQELTAAAPALARDAQGPAEPAPRPVKYRHPVSGETWDGSGPHPQWMRQALLHDGYRVEELRVAPIHEEDHHARPAA